MDGCPPVTKYYGQFHESWDGDATDATRLSNWLDPNNTNATTTDLIRSPSFSWSGSICYSGSTYTMFNPPSGVTITWSGTNVVYPNGNTGTSVTVRAPTSSTSSSGIITATFTVNNTQYTITHDVWVGKPQMPTTIPSGYPTVQLDLGQLFTVRIDSMPGCLTVDSVNWWSTGSIDEISSTTGSQCTFEAVSLGTGNFKVQTENGCGFSTIGGGTVNVSGGGGGPLGPMLMVFPNPATEYFEIQLDESIATSDEKEIESEVRIYDQFNNLKEIRKFKGKTHKISTNKLSKGLYLVEVVNENGKFTAKVIINKK